MIYTGYEGYTEEELLAHAVIDHHPLALELAKRITNHRPIPRLSWELERQSLVGAGVNPIPNPSMGEDE